MLIVIDDIIADIISIKNPNQVETELFIRERKINTSFFFFFFTQTYFPVPKDIRLNRTLFLF